MRSPTLGNPPAAPECEPRRLVGELFHELSQPLTTLCCSLELALLEAHTSEQDVEIVSRALGQAEKASSLVTGIRELFDAGEAGADGEVLELQTAVENAVGDLLPVAESAGVQIHYRPGPACRVWFDVRRLRQGLFHLLGFVVSAGGEGSAVKIELSERGPEAVLGLTVSGEGTHSGASTANPDQDLVRRLGLGIARAIFEVAGGSFSVGRTAEQLSVSVRLPLRVHRVMRF